jgi:phosphoserine aminotransferase
MPASRRTSALPALRSSSPKRDLLAKSPKKLPTMFQYATFLKKDSLYNTPPAFNIYVVGKVAAWIKAQGGLEEMAKRNKKKADLLYGVIDDSNGYYQGHAEKASRSFMNVTFRLPNEDLEKKFVAEALENKLGGVKGHRSVGGMRASIYNAMPYEGVEALADFMKKFQKANA